MKLLKQSKKKMPKLKQMQNLILKLQLVHLASDSTIP